MRRVGESLHSEEAVDIFAALLGEEHQGEFLDNCS
jgi:hypothetical protein